MTALHWHFIICVSLGKWAEAGPLLREAVPICDEVQPSGYSSTFCSQLRCQQGPALVRDRKFAEAEPMLLAGYEGLKGKTGKGDVLYEQESMRLLAEVCDLTSRPAEAAQWRHKLAESAAG